METCRGLAIRRAGRVVGMSTERPSDPYANHACPVHERDTSGPAARVGDAGASCDPRRCACRHRDSWPSGGASERRSPVHDLSVFHRLHVAVSAPQTHYIEVEARYPAGGPTLDLMMAVWTPARTWCASTRATSRASPRMRPTAARWSSARHERTAGVSRRAAQRPCGSAIACMAVRCRFARTGWNRASRW